MEDLRNRVEELERQLAESRAAVGVARREAEVEAALERVRSRTMAMRSSDELAETASVLFQQLDALHMLPPTSRTYISIVDRQTESSEAWMTRPDGTVRPSSHRVPLTEHPSMTRYFEDWTGNKELIVRDYVGPALHEYLEFVLSLPHTEEDEGYQRLAASPPERIVMTDAVFSAGSLGVMSAELLTPDAQEVLQRFARTFEQTYTRYEDIQRLEVQNREVEAALTELRTTQAQLVQSEKMASLGQLTAGIAHEIKNPLNFVNNFASLSQELIQELGEEVDPEARAAILADLRVNAAKIEEHGRRADAIVTSMMEHARSGTGSRQLVDVNRLVEESVAHAEQAMRVRHPELDPTIILQLQDEVGKADIVPQEIGRVLNNLVDNALYATRQRVADEPSSFVPTVIVSTLQADGEVEIRVTDNGVGMSEAVRARLFEPFFTTKPTGEGTGLGLSMSYDIVAQGHRGSLKVESEQGAGSTLIVRLPAKPRESHATTPSSGR